MKKLRITSLIMALCLLFFAAAPSAYALDEPDVVASSVCIVDADTGRILYSKNLNGKVYPASLTKIMTVLLAVMEIENGNHTLDEEITAQDDCRIFMEDDSSTADIYPGEIMTYEDLLYCCMLASANEACNILATYISGSRDAFVQEMNAFANKLGCTGTCFNNTNGLNDTEHYTTAYDLYLITKEAVQHPLFMTLCNAISHTIPATNTHGERTYYNSNALISADSIYGSSYLYNGAAGVKTGYTRDAGYCLISTCSRNDINLICVVLGSTGVLNSQRADYGNFVDSIALYDWAYENFVHDTVLTTADPIERVPVALAAGDGNAILRPQNDVTLLISRDFLESDMVIDTEIYSDLLTAPIEAGTVLGSATITVKGEYYASVNLVTNIDIEMSKSEYLKLQISNIVSSTWFKVGVSAVIIIFILYLLLVVRYRKLRQKHLREKKLAEIRRRKAWEQQYAGEQPGLSAGKQQSFSSGSASGAEKNPEPEEDPDDFWAKYR